jgi:hypothetical protein
MARGDATVFERLCAWLRDGSRARSGSLSSFDPEHIEGWRQGGGRRPDGGTPRVVTGAPGVSMSDIQIAALDTPETSKKR